MDKSVGVFNSIERWIGKEPELGSNRLQMLWDENGESGVPFDPAGANLLIDILDKEFSDRTIKLRVVDILELTVDGLIDAIPDGPLSMAVAADGPVPHAASAARAPFVVTLSDDSIERLATRLTAHLAPHLSPQPQENKPQDEKPQEKKPHTRGGRAASQPKKSKKGR